MEGKEGAEIENKKEEMRKDLLEKRKQKEEIDEKLMKRVDVLGIEFDWILNSPFGNAFM